MLLTLWLAFLMWAPFISAGDALTIGGLVIAWLGQHLKAQKAFPSWATQGILLAIGFGFFALANPYNGDGWLRNGFMWACALPGMASIAASVKLAPATDSR